MKIVMSCALGLLLATGAWAHQNPPACNGNGVNVNLARIGPGGVLNGTVVTYAVSASNVDNPSIGLRTCDADSIAVVFHCPAADGTPTGVATVLTTTLALPAGTPAMSLGHIDCTINVNPGVTDAVADVTMGDQPTTPLAEFQVGTTLH